LLGSHQSIPFHYSRPLAPVLGQSQKNNNSFSPSNAFDVSVPVPIDMVA
jgi:hypothetical protein